MSSKYALLIDMSRCVGCRTCTVACKMENHVAGGINRMRVFNPEGNLHFDRPVGTFPHLRMYWTPVSCQHCDEAPCVKACPSGALSKRTDGIVDLNKAKCIGCHYCNWVCPYDAAQFDEEAGVSDKCTLCAHRIDQGEEPFCVVCCPARALKLIDMNNPDSAAVALLNRRSNKALLPEKGTRPSNRYLF